MNGVSLCDNHTINILFLKRVPIMSVDTIFALATPPGRSAIAVIRISGPKAITSPELFAANCPAAGHFSLARLWVGNQVIDEVMILFMAGPKSSTGEDVCEIHCHGSTAVVQLILDILTKAVARIGF